MQGQGRVLELALALALALELGRATGFELASPPRAASAVQAGHRGTPWSSSCAAAVQQTGPWARRACAAAWTFSPRRRLGLWALAWGRASCEWCRRPSVWVLRSRTLGQGWACWDLLQHHCCWMGASWNYFHYCSAQANGGASSDCRGTTQHHANPWLQRANADSPRARQQREGGDGPK